MKNYNYGIENLGKENFLKCRTAFRKELNELIVEIRRFKANRKRKTDFYKESGDRIAFYEGQSWFDYRLFELSKRARVLTILLGVFNCTPLEKIDNFTDVKKTYNLLFKNYKDVELEINNYIKYIVSKNTSRIINE